MIRRIVAFIAVLALIPQVQAQDSSLKEIISGTSVGRIGDNVVVSVEVDLDRVRIRRTRMMTLTPVIRSVSGDEAQELPRIVIAGRNKAKVLKRAGAVGNPAVAENGHLVELHRRSGIYSYEVSVPYRKWMSGGELSVNGITTGCASCSAEDGKGSLMLADNVIPYPVPQYRVNEESGIVTYSDGEDGSGLRRRFSILYTQGDADVNKELGGNTGEFAGFERTLGGIMRHSHHITGISIEGYASPEGTSAFNMELSEDRARALLQYFTGNYGLSPDIITLDWKGADWKGFRELLVRSDIPQKDALFDVIDRNMGHDEKLAALGSIEGGSVYEQLLNEIFPSLRKVVCSIEFDVSPDILYEMLLCEAIREAVTCIREGDLREAIDILEPYGSEPDTWNILGVAYGRSGNAVEAGRYFRKAASSGCPDGMHNLAELQRSEEY